MQEKNPLLHGSLKRTSAPFWKVLIIVIGASMMAVMGGTTNAFDVISEKVQHDLDLTGEELALLSGFGMLGLYFVIPVGMALDYLGPVKTGTFCTLLASGAYLAMSYCTPKLWPVALICLTVVSFGAGGIFMSALGTSILVSPTGGGWTVSVVSAAMSFSVAFTFQFTNVYTKITGCDEDHCWRNYVRLYAATFLILPLIGSLLLILFKKEDYPHLTAREMTTSLDSEETDPHNKPVTILESLQVFKDSYFWILMFSFFCGIGSSVLVLSHATQIWNSYNKTKDLESWGPQILFMFSFFNAGGNLISGIASDWLAKKNIMKHPTYVAIVQLVFSLLWIAIGIMLSTKNPGGSASIILPFLLAGVGFSFGTYLVLFPMMVADLYGSTNFGKYFGYLEISSSIASIIFPLIAASIKSKFNSYVSVAFGSAALLLISGIVSFKTPKSQKNQYEVINS